MDMMDVASILQDVADKNAQMVELLQTKFAQDFQQVTAKTVGDPNKTTIQRIDAAIAAMDTLIKSMGVYSTKTNSALAEIKKDLKEVHTGSGKDLSSDEITAVVTRRMKEWTVNKNENVLNYETKKAKSSESTQTIKKEFSEKIVEKMDSCTDRLIQFFTGESDPDKVKKKNKSFIADFVTAIATNKAVGGIFEDLVKLVALFGASFLAQFGTIGKLVGAGLVMFLPALAPVLLKVMGQGLARFVPALMGALGPYLVPILTIAAVLGGIYWLFNKDKAKRDEDGNIVNNGKPGAIDYLTGNVPKGERGFGGVKDLTTGKYSLTSEQWKEASSTEGKLGVPGFMNYGRMTVQRANTEALRLFSENPEAMNAGFTWIDKNSDIGKRINWDTGMKFSISDRNSEGISRALAGSDFQTNAGLVLGALDELGYKDTKIQEIMQTSGNELTKEANSRVLSGTVNSMNAPSGNSFTLGGFKDSKEAEAALKALKKDLALKAQATNRDNAGIRAIRRLVGLENSVLKDNKYYQQGYKWTDKDSKLLELVNNITFNKDTGEWDIGGVRVRNLAPYLKGDKEGEGLVVTEGASQQAQTTSSNTYNLPELPKVPEIDKGSENKGYDGKEIKSEAYPLPDVKQINVDKESLPEVEPPNFNKDGGLDIIGNARTSRILARLNNISLFSADTALGGQIA